MSELFKDLLETPAPPEAVKRNKGSWGFTTEHLPHDPKAAIVTAVTDQQLKGDAAIAQFITAQGGVIPSGYRARLVEMRHQTHGWTRSNKADPATTAPVFFYRFAIEPISGFIDVDELVKLVSKKKPAKKTPQLDDTVYHFCAGDTQLGKADGDGVEGTIATYRNSLDEAVKEWKAAGKPRVQVIFAGDCIEGVVSQGGKNAGYRTTLTLTEQLRVFRRLMLETIDAFIEAPVLEVDVVGGNHDDAMRHPINSRPDDNFATDSAIAVADAMQLNPERYGHVRIFVPEKDADHIVRQVGSVVVLAIHGNQWRRGQSMQWLAGQALNKRPAAEADIVVHGHEHEFSVQSRKKRLILCVPSFEDFSNWWRNKTGDEGKRGALTFISTGGTFKGLTIV